MEWAEIRQTTRWQELSYLAAFALSSHPGMKKIISPDSINPMKPEPPRRKVPLEYVVQVLFGES